MTAAGSEAIVPVVAGARPAGRWRAPRRAALVALAVVAAGAYLALRGRHALAHDDEAAAFRALNGLRDWVDANRDRNPVFLYAVNYLRLGVALLVAAVQAALTWLGWSGVTALAVALAAVFAGGWRALATAAGCAGLGALGLWAETRDTLALTLAAVVLAVAIGVPLGVLAARVRAVRALLTPVLDVMQIMPTFAYLAPMTLLFLIGTPSATLATLVYAMPPAIRITALGLAQVPPATVEAAASLGPTRWQLLRTVRLPLARPAILLAVNQTIMMALSMVVVTALVDAPGLGQSIIRALERVDVGAAFDAGIAIVGLAVLLDRLTTWAARHARAAGRPGAARRRTCRVAAAALAAAGLAAAPVASADFPGPRLSLAAGVNAAVGWAETTLYPVTGAVRDLATAGLVDPVQRLLTGAPWWLVICAALLAGGIAGSVRAAGAAAAALAAIVPLGLWRHAMETLATVLVAAAVTVGVGLALGVAAARRDRVAALLRPLLDAAQTLPCFVYLLPAVALFGASRFTAVVAAVIYAVPPVARLVENGVRAVPATAVEAALAAGSTRRQLLWKVQLPIARPELLLAANQGVVMVLAMVVVGGLVGAGALGYDVVAGFSQSEDFGKGFAAGLATVLLGVALDRLGQAAGGRGGAARPRPAG